MWPFSLFKKKATPLIPVTQEWTDSRLNYHPAPATQSLYNYPNEACSSSSSDDLSSMLASMAAANVIADNWSTPSYEQDCKAPEDNPFQGFDGGSSGGAGASDSWDSDDDSSDSSYDSSDSSDTSSDSSD